jgi:hypothetical protein
MGGRKNHQTQNLFTFAQSVIPFPVLFKSTTCCLDVPNLRIHPDNFEILLRHSHPDLNCLTVSATLNMTNIAALLAWKPGSNTRALSQWQFLTVFTPPHCGDEVPRQ